MTVTVSVIIPCYQQAQFLSDSIASLTRQSLDSWEAIIVDDGSPDDTQSIAVSLMATDTRVRYVKKPNGGLSSARNAGLRLACGEFIQFLDADDLIESRKLELHSAFLQRTDFDIVYGNAWYFVDGRPEYRIRNGYGPRWRRDEDWIRRRAQDPAPMAARLLRRPQFPVCAALVRRTAFERIGMFNEELRRLEDWEYWIRCATGGAQSKFLEPSGTAALVRMHSSSTTADRRAMIRSEFELAMAVLEYVADPKLRLRAFQLAASGMEGFDADDWNERYEFLKRKAACDPTATRWLRLYRALCGPLRPQSIERRLALRLAKALA
jgi:glycosyltransferase involved in cell wall biosynthesis